VFQLVKTYTFGAYTYPRTIKKPVTGSTVIYFDGAPQGAGWSIDTTTGLVTFGAAPGNGVVITADFEFDVPARFDTDQMQATIEDFNLYAWGAIPIVEVRV